MPRSRILRLMLAIFALLATTAVLAVGVLYLIFGNELADTVRDAGLQLRLRTQRPALLAPASTSTQTVRFVILPGETPAIIARNLLQNGLISDVTLFVDYVAAYDIDRQLEAGVYFLTPAENIITIAQRLTDSRSSQLPFRILEGWRREEIAEAIDASGLFGFSGADFLVATGSSAIPPNDFTLFVTFPLGNTLEGFLFPDTYNLPPDISAEELRDFLLLTFVERVGADLARDAYNQGFTLYQIVTLAAIAEREALHDDEHGAIMGVYRNRLLNSMRLDADPTIQYALNGARGRWWPPLTLADYRGVASVYNTYLNDGLPPGPIANPGLSAIRAAIYPDVSPFLFFRARCDGSGYHAYAVTYDEHLQNAC